ncbi:cytochrome c oxidase assembly factor CtaG [Mycobacterium frederiksbergense]|uniref:Cytochrome c oxidase assembly factor CtaG n=1 Tax=Mycolicibacterium frederiksbergense TaxID=117567 RepID=A0ABT6KV92_9MYCO|nr:cytochrome c oxidase assembly protein [Mycolicibacterium frederiksbergense]MDH6194633.1 cytochrome c oxidase assembly factor CtaG [Mycolicibacterium frederiksbergense]
MARELMSGAASAWWGRLTLLGSIAGSAVLLFVAALQLGAQRLADAGLTDPGTTTSTALLLGHWTATLAGAVCAGALVWIVTTATPREDGRIDTASFPVHLLLERAAIVWACSATSMVVISAAAASGIPVGRLIASPGLGSAIAASEVARGWCAAAICATVLAVGVRFTLRWIGHCVALLPTLIGIVAVPVTGNAGQGPDHDIATSAVVVFAVAVAVWAGTKIVSAGLRDVVVRRRIQAMQLACGAVAVLYGVLLATLMLGGLPILGSQYGRAVLVAGVLLALVWLGDGALLLMRRTPSRWINSLSAAAMIAVTAALALAANSVPPRFTVHEFTTWDIFLGYQLDAPPNPLNLITEWRFDPLIGTAAIVLALGYLLAVLRLRRRGDHWPVGRTVAWTLGCAALLIATSSGVRAYGSAMFSVHMGEHMALNMFIPVVLVLGAPVTLALRVLPAAPNGQAPGPREWLTWLVHAPLTRFLSHPVTAFVLFVGSLYLVYFTPLFNTLIRYHWGHEFMSVHFLLTGYLYYWGIIGIDPGPRRLPFLGRLGLLFAVMPFHAFFGIATMTMTSTLGGSFYQFVGLPWLQSISDDQHLGGAIAWGSSELPVIIVVVALVAQWARQDRRIGARQDRHSDRGYDEELDDYNAMLRELARNRR